MRVPLHQHEYVSIHSPRRGGGRRAFSEANPGIKVFQSTPPAEAEGDILAGRGAGIVVTFQSTPPAEAEGDTRPCKAGFDKSLAGGFREPCD